MARTPVFIHNHTRRNQKPSGVRRALFSVREPGKLLEILYRRKTSRGVAPWRTFYLRAG